MSQDDSRTAAPQCPRCAGPVIPACECLRLVFRGGEQYIFAVDESVKTVTIRLSSAAIGLFQSHSIGAGDLARIAAQWGLSHEMTSVDLALTGKDFADLYLAVSPYLEAGLRQVT